LVGRRRITRKRAAAVLAPVAAGITVLGLGTGTAAAASVTEEAEFTYTNSSGQAVTCFIFSSNDFDPSRDDTGFTQTFVSGPPGCEESFVDIVVTYLGPGREPHNAEVGGIAGAFGSFEPVAEDFRTDHVVDFFDCDFEVSDCSYDVTLVQPK
jgi:hypothetical protein